MQNTFSSSQPLRIGWAAADITPDRTAVIGGMPWARLSSGVMDKLTATVLALETHPPGQHPQPVIFVGCDLRGIREALRDAVRAQLTEKLPALDPLCVILNAVHTHNAPPLGTFGIDLEGMSEDDYVAFAAPRIAVAITEAWHNRSPGGIGYGLGQAVVGRNRLIAYTDASSKMYGATDVDNFSHVEGYEDHSVNVLCTWNSDRKLTGMVVNLAAPSQVSRSLTAFSADYWHDTREALRAQLGPGLFVLPQCSSAGDQDTNVLWDKAADERMLRLAGRSRRAEIAARLTQAITTILPLIEREIDWAPVLAHDVRTVQLPRRMLGEDDLQKALADAQPHREIFERMMAELEVNPALRNDPEWLKQATRAFWNARRGETVQKRFELQKTEPRFAIEMHAVRIGDLAVITNPFELFLDYGIRIKARSPAVQTFIVQLASGSSGYLPTERSVAGGAYGAVPASTNIGPEGGRLYVAAALERLNALWEK
ncbi:MAG: hypothetical protein LC725_07545 [Lentisphaerae bacterium]|nr:hypothetical protein [Lentisphaerota bacterium]